MSSTWSLGSKDCGFSSESEPEAPKDQSRASSAVGSSGYGSGTESRRRRLSSDDSPPSERKKFRRAEDSTRTSIFVPERVVEGYKSGASSAVGSSGYGSGTESRRRRRSSDDSPPSEPKKFRPAEDSIQTSSFVTERVVEGHKSRASSTVGSSGYGSGTESRRRRSSDDSPPSEPKKFRPAEDSIQSSSFVTERVVEGYKDVKAERMMKMMGYKAGTGLGKNKQGRVEPVEASKQRGFRGLGFKIPELEPASLEWNSESEQISVEEEVDWLKEENHTTLEHGDLDCWIEIGPRKKTIDDEINFCDPKVIGEILKSKTIFDQLEEAELRKAVSKANPFETIKGGIFLNRAAMKMANLDKVFDFMFTQPKSQTGECAIGKNSLLYFADVCAGPGGFSEYVLWRHKWEAKGFGFTLKASNDFKLSDFYAGPCESFEPHYGTGDGDVYRQENQMQFADFVKSNTGGEGVHFMMADGGFSVEGQENIQEILSKQLYLCQCLVALLIVRTGGHFVVKLFDVFTEFSVGLIYLMYKSFHEISIHKPNTSRPANSERYLVCKWKRDDCSAIKEYMLTINEQLCKLTNKSNDVNVIVPMSVLKKDETFFDYIRYSNNTLGARQIVGLAKVIAYSRDNTLEELQQAKLRKSCLDYWGVPDEARTVPRKLNPDDLCKKLLSSQGGTKQDILMPDYKELVDPKKQFEFVHNWHFLLFGSEKPKSGSTSAMTFFIGLGRSNVYQLCDGAWKKLPDLFVELSPGTLLVGEIVKELRGRGFGQHWTNCLHIMDALYLGGKCIFDMDVSERHMQCSLFAQAMNKPSRTDITGVRVKELFELTSIDLIRKRITQTQLKGKHCLNDAFELDENFTYIPRGIMFINGIKDPWNCHFSQRQGMKYYYHKDKKVSVFGDRRPQDSKNSFGECFKNRVIWWCDSKWQENLSELSEVVKFLKSR